MDTKLKRGWRRHLRSERMESSHANPYFDAMPLKITTWNINSIRQRIDQVARCLKSAPPDEVCLQETTCPDYPFPMNRFKRLSYEHAALNGQKGYHGVAVLSRVPLEK